MIKKYIQYNDKCPETGMLPSSKRHVYVTHLRKWKILT